MYGKSVSIMAGLCVLVLGVAGCASAPVGKPSRGTQFEPPAGCILQKGERPNTLVCDLPGTATSDRRFSVWTDFGPATAAQRTGHAQSADAYWIAVMEDRRRRAARVVGTVVSESFAVEDPDPRNATACLRSAIRVSNPQVVGDVRVLDCVYFDQVTNEVIWASVELVDGRTVSGAPTQGFERAAEQALSTFRFVLLPQTL